MPTSPPLPVQLSPAAPRRPGVRSRARRAAVLALLTLGVLLGGGVGPAGPTRAGAEPPASYEQALARHRERMKRPSLYKRLLAREGLARTGDARALEVLARDYEKPEEPRDHVRYTLVTMAATHLGSDAALLPAWTAWRRRYPQPEHLWLWFRATTVEARLGGRDALGLVGSAAADPLLRAAVLRGWAQARPVDATVPRDATVPGGAAAAALALAALPASGPGRGVVAEAAALALVEAAPDETADARWLVLERLIELLTDKGVTARSRLVLARALGRVLRGPEGDVGGSDLDPEVWRRELAAARQGGAAVPAPAAEAAPAEPERYAGPRFVGLRASGRRLVYVIDASDSMLAPLEGAERESLTRPVTPGPGAPRAAPAPDDLPWDRIRTRFDAARECLKASLARLDKERSFCVVLFGDEAAPLAATPGLVPATAKAVRAAIAELDAVSPASTDRTAEFPHGQLRGGTNLHGGLRRAFQVRGRSSVPRDEHVDLRLLEEGCDTVFLLSDGVPSWDDFATADLPDPEDESGNPESGAAAERTPTLIFDGPYGQEHARGDYLAEDVRRMNLLRNAEIHCVAVGEADDDLLTRLAALGLGRVRRVGAAPAPAAPAPAAPRPAAPR